MGDGVEAEVAYTIYFAWKFVRLQSINQKSSSPASIKQARPKCEQ